MKKLNNNGFILAETLVVCVFLMVTFSIMYNNLYPLMGEYERRENYDDIDSKYAIYWIKRMIQNADYQLNTYDITTKKYAKFSCSQFTDETNRNLCQSTLESMNAKATDIYIISYNTTEFKNAMKNSTILDTRFKDYVNYLPYYRAASLNNATYRVVMKFHRTKDNNDYYTYATIEVKK